MIVNVNAADVLYGADMLAELNWFISAYIEAILELDVRYHPALTYTQICPF